MMLRTMALRRRLSPRVRALLRWCVRIALIALSLLLPLVFPWPASACLMEPQACIDSAQYNLWYGFAQWLWASDRSLLQLAYSIGQFRWWVVEVAYGFVYNILAQSLGPVLPQVAAIAILLAIVCFFLLPVVGDLRIVDLRQALMWAVLAPAVLTLVGPQLITIETLRTRFSGVIIEQGAEAITSIPIFGAAASNMVAPTPLYPSNPCGNGELNRRDEGIQPDDLAAALVGANAGDIHCPDAQNSGASGTLPDAFFDEAGPVYFATTLDIGSELTGSDRAAAVERMQQGATRLALTLLPSVFAVTDALVNLVFALCLVTMWLGLPVALLVVYFRQTSAAVTQLFKQTVAVLQVSWAVAALTGILLVCLRSTAELTNASAYAGFAFGGLLLSCYFLYLAFSTLKDCAMTLNGAVLAATGLAPVAAGQVASQSVGATAKATGDAARAGAGAAAVLGGAVGGAAFAGIQATRSVGNLGLGLAAAAGTWKPLLQTADIANAMGLVPDTVADTMYAGQRSQTNPYQARKMLDSIGQGLDARAGIDAPGGTSGATGRGNAPGRPSGGPSGSSPSGPSGGTSGSLGSGSNSASRGASIPSTNAEPAPRLTTAAATRIANDEELVRQREAMAHPEAKPYQVAADHFTEQIAQVEQEEQALNKQWDDKTERLQQRAGRARSRGNRWKANARDDERGWAEVQRARELVPFQNRKQYLEAQRRRSQAQRDDALGVSPSDETTPTPENTSEPIVGTPLETEPDLQPASRAEDDAPGAATNDSSGGNNVAETTTPPLAEQGGSDVADTANAATTQVPETTAATPKTARKTRTQSGSMKSASGITSVGEAQQRPKKSSTKGRQKQSTTSDGSTAAAPAAAAPATAPTTAPTTAPAPLATEEVATEAPREKQGSAQTTTAAQPTSTQPITPPAIAALGGYAVGPNQYMVPVDGDGALPQLVAQGYAVSEPMDGMVRVTGAAPAGAPPTTDSLAQGGVVEHAYPEVAQLVQNANGAPAVVLPPPSDAPDISARQTAVARLRDAQYRTLQQPNGTVIAVAPSWNTPTPDLGDTPHQTGYYTPPGARIGRTTLGARAKQNGLQAHATHDGGTVIVPPADEETKHA